MAIPEVSYDHFRVPLSAESAKEYPKRPPLSGQQVPSSNILLSRRRSPLLPKVSLISVLIIQSIGVIGFFASIYLSLDKHVDLSGDSSYRTILAYLLIFIIATLFAIFIAIDSLLNKNVSQLLALCIFNISMGVYGAILPHQIERTIDPLVDTRQIPDKLRTTIQWRLVVVPAIAGTCSIVLLALTWYFHQEFGWDMYRRLGADIQRKKALKIKCTFFMLQKFNLFFLIGFCIQTVLFHVDDLESIDLVLPAVALLASCFVILFATVGVEHELKWVMSLYYLVWALAGAFLCYEIVKIYPRAVKYNNQRSFILFSSFTLGMLLSTGICSIPCWFNFGKGLKEARIRSAWLAPFRAKRRTQPSEHSLSDGSMARPILD